MGEVQLYSRHCTNDGLIQTKPVDQGFLLKLITV